jgi:hypothetical protein
MKSKNVIVLLLSLTLTLVMNAKPVVDRDIGLVTRSSPEAVIVPALDNVVYEIVAIEPLTLSEPVFVRTTESSTSNISVSEIQVPTIFPKCRDVDLCRLSETNYNISARIPRSRTAYLHNDGGGGHGEPV